MVEDHGGTPRSQGHKRGPVRGVTAEDEQTHTQLPVVGASPWGYDHPA